MSPRERYIHSLFPRKWPLQHDASHCTLDPNPSSQTSFLPKGLPNDGLDDAADDPSPFPPGSPPPRIPPPPPGSGGAACPCPDGGAASFPAPGGPRPTPRGVDVGCEQRW